MMNAAELRLQKSGPSAILRVREVDSLALCVAHLARLVPLATIPQGRVGIPRANAGLFAGDTMPATTAAKREDNRSYYLANREAILEKERARSVENPEKKRANNAAWYAANKDKVRARGAARYAANPEAVSARGREYRAANLGACQERSRKYHAANREAIRNQQKAYRAANVEAIRAKRRARYATNPEARSAVIRAYRAANPEYVRARERAQYGASPEKKMVTNANRRALKLAAPGRGVTAAQWREIAAAAKGLCAYCGEVRKLTMDHKEPLKPGGAHDIDNIAACCRSCNSSKGATPLNLWLARGNDPASGRSILEAIQEVSP